MLEGMTIRDTKGKPTIRDSKGKPRKLKRRHAGQKRATDAVSDSSHAKIKSAGLSAAAKPAERTQST
jgi:hypothetical protein